MKRIISVMLCSVFIILVSCGNSFSVDDEYTENHLSETDGASDVITSVPEASPLEETTFNEVENTVGNNSSSRSFYGKNTGTDLTATGLEPLENQTFALNNSSSSKGLSTDAISHSYGVAADEMPHRISVEAQKFFNERNFDAICYDDKSDEKVIYLTFDCGYENGYTGKILDVLKEKNVPAAFFCTLPQMKDNHDIIARMINEGHVVGNHSVTHPDFSLLSDSQIVDELKGFDDYIRQNFGYSSLYFRYPQGKYSEKALDTVNSLGYKCVFWSLAYADWDLENQKGETYAFETVMSRIHPGAVILLHAVSPDNANSLDNIIDACREKGYVFKSLESL